MVMKTCKTPGCLETFDARGRQIYCNPSCRRLHRRPKHLTNIARSVLRHPDNYPAYQVRWARRHLGDR